MRKYWENPIATGDAPASSAHVPESFRVGAVRISPATVLAPMAGVTDTVFRRFIRNVNLKPDHDQLLGGRESGCGLIMTEFTSADGILRAKDKKAKRYLHFYEDEHPISAQLFGSNPEVMATAAGQIEQLGFDIVDLNLGCPAKKVVKCNGGSGLLRDLPAIGKIFESVRAAVTIPFTVKFRAGWSDEEIVCVELAKLAESCGLQAVALHARTREQGYAGNANWDWIAAIKAAVTIPVIGNGDIRTPLDAANMVAQTGCDAVMIGRTAASNPWIFRQIAQFTDTGRYDEPTEADRYAMIRTYFEMLVAEGFPDSIGKMKQFTSWFTHGVRNGSQLRAAVYTAKTAGEVLENVHRFFAASLDNGAASREAANYEKVATASTA
jgi:nifR3 family TIM-barrel protein